MYFAKQYRPDLEDWIFCQTIFSFAGRGRS